MIIINEEKNTITIEQNKTSCELSLASEEGFLALSKVWLTSSWDTKHMYSFTWLGTPIIQLPEDLLRIQEIIFTLKPDVIIETGVNYGGSLLFYASLCSLLKKGQVIGIELTPREEMKHTIAHHPLSPFITLIEGNSVLPETVARVKDTIKSDAHKVVLVILDSKHSKKHVLEELEAYAPLVTPGSYIIVMDGIMGHLKHALRKRDEWEWNNPEQAAREFVQKHTNFTIEYPPFLFNDGKITQPITNCPQGFLKKIH